MMGFDIMENFKAPYFARNVQEFWRRWHISLSTWFRDYVYIPLGGNKCSPFRKNLNLFITFLVSGIWHGANWTYIVWGMIHGVYQIIGKMTLGLRNKIYKKTQVKTDCFSFRLGQQTFTFALISFAWIFFRSKTIKDAFRYIILLFTRNDIWTMFNGEIYNLGLTAMQINILFISLLLLFIVDYKKYKNNINIDEILLKQNLIFRAGVIIFLFMATFVFGVYGPEFNAQEFIYSQF